ncbi:MAG: macrocin O-methyltransferase [Sulfurimonas sp.]|nr:macrocin O-methyltransferase [Sulfurimonas sp.]MDD3834166.1 macrocin O-methyltransferase [Sulfurimonas sp.]
MFNKDYEGINLEFYKNDFSKWSKKDEIEYNNNEIRYKERYRFFQNAFDYLSANFIIGNYFEFGVHKARTFRIALSEAKKKDIDSMNFYAFDSFEGLPEASSLDKFPNWEKGMLKTSLEFFDKLTQEHNLYNDKIHKIKGFYNKSLTKELSNKMLLTKEKASIIYIDCDFYESAKDVLEFIVPFIQDGTILCFDDWNVYKGHPYKGEKRAFGEFKTKYNDMFYFEDFLTIGWMGKSFILNKK